MLCNCKNLFNQNVLYFPIPFVNARPIVVVPASLPFGINISVPFFRVIKPYHDYDLFDEVVRQSDHLDEIEKIKWMIRWLHGEDPIQH